MTEYREPADLRGVLELLAAEGPGVKLLAGGQSLIPALYMRQIRPGIIVGLAGVPELAGVEVDGGGGLRIGAMTTQRALETSILLRNRCRVLAQTSGLIASVHVRNLGTIGGNLCQNVPGADFPPALIALDTVVTLASVRGERRVAVAELCRGGSPAPVASDEVLTDVRVPPLAPGARAVYLKHRAGGIDRALVGVAATVELGGDGVTCADVRLGIGGASEIPYRSLRAEAVLRGQPLDDARIAEAGRVAADECDPRADAHASADYRRKMVAVFVRRALTEARDGRTAGARAAGVAGERVSA